MSVTILRQTILLNQRKIQAFLLKFYNIYISIDQ